MSKYKEYVKRNAVCCRSYSLLIVVVAMFTEEDYKGKAVNVGQTVTVS